jgi:heptosyltransferase III
MAPVLEHLPPGARVLVIRLRSLGDCVLTTPALRLLKEFRPDLEIGVVVEPRFRGIFEDNPGIAHLLEPNLLDVLRFGSLLTVNLHGGTRSQWLTAFSLGRERAGFAHHRGSAFYTTRIPRAQQILGEERPVHTAEHLASAMFYLGVPRTEIPRAQLFAPTPRQRAPYAVLHPFAATPAKTWPADRFLKVADNLKSSGLTPIFLGGPGDDFTPFSAYEILAGAPLRETKTVLSGATLFIGNDSGPAHIAAAFAVPVVVLFGPSDPVVWAPWRTDSRVIHSPKGLHDVPVDRVLQAAASLGVAR